MFYLHNTELCCNPHIQHD